jgi:hypothetical protein
MKDINYEALKNTVCKSRIFQNILINEYHKNSIEVDRVSLLNRVSLFEIAYKSNLKDVINVFNAIKFIK